MPLPSDLLPPTGGPLTCERHGDRPAVSTEFLEALLSYADCECDKICHHISSVCEADLVDLARRPDTSPTAHHHLRSLAATSVTMCPKGTWWLMSELVSRPETPISWVSNVAMVISSRVVVAKAATHHPKATPEVIAGWAVNLCDGRGVGFVNHWTQEAFFDLLQSADPSGALSETTAALLPNWQGSAGDLVQAALDIVRPGVLA